ncbi:MAG TPA: hypothetical protein DHV62_08130 [Elusimicrobia bacterium]|jgi:hypothetical protein|nr:hypothetical protein [Elusimicrobiota bacterium]
MNEKNETIPVILNIDLVVNDFPGVKAKNLNNGDIVYSFITDKRDIGQYLARLLGGMTKDGHVPLATEIEKISLDGEMIKLQVRFTPGIVGLTTLEQETRVKVLKRNKEPLWWQKILNLLLNRTIN